MATVTYTADKDASAMENGDAWSGYDDHLPVGQNSNSYQWASFVHFNINFSGMTAITSATLRLRGAQVDFVTHNNGSSSTTLYIRRMTSDWGVGSNRGENSWSSSETWGWNNRVAAGYTTSGQTSVVTGPQSSSWNNVEKSYDVTSIVRAWAPVSAGGSGAANYGFQLKNSSSSSADGIEFYSRRYSGREPELDIVYSTNTAPTAPTLNSPINLAIVNDLTPSLVFTRNDVDSGDYISAYEVSVYNDSGGTSLKWTSGQVTTGSTSATQWTATVGTTLTGNTTYYWKARTRDKGNAWSPFSALEDFKTNTAPPTPSSLSPASGATVTTLTPTFSGYSDDPDPGDQLAYKQVIVYNDAAGTSQRWSSGESAATGSTWSIAYAGTALASGTTYYWKARVKDTNGAYSAYTALYPFTTYTVGTPTGMAPSNSKVNTLTPTFTGTAAVTMNAYQYVLYQTNGTTQVYDSGTVAATGTAVSAVYGGAPALSWGTNYKWKLRTRDTGGVWSNYSALQPFWTNTSPTATQVSPSSGSVVTTLTPDFTANYSDADKNNGFTDNPTNYTVEVSRVSDSVVMHTLSDSTSLNTNQNTIARAAEGTALSYDVTYRWRARYTDSSGAANATGSYTGYWTFKPTQIPIVTSFAAQAADLTTGSINKPNPTFTWSFSGSGGKTQIRSRIAIQVGDALGEVIYDSGELQNTSASQQIPGGYLQNGVTYYFLMVAKDTDGLYSLTDTVTYTTAWTPPPALTAFSITADDIQSRISLSWDASAQSDVDFNKYTVYRKRLDTGEQEYTAIANITTKSENYYHDYSAAISATYEYYVTQWKTIDGDSPLESPMSEVISTSLQADSWFIVVPSREDLTLELAAVSGERHQAPFQEETFEPFGRTRKVVVRSGRYGTEGDIEWYWDASERVAAEAKLDSILSLRDTVYLKSPFGDTFKVTLGAPEKTYLNGGHLVTRTTYVEVS